MRKFKRPFLLGLAFLGLALVAHSYILFRFFKDGLLFTGPNDGIEQMVPIQMYLYQKWSEGTFFYATDFGLGGDFFTDLSYYFTTNFLFILIVIVVKCLHLLHLVQPNTLMFWFHNAIVVSILKCALVLAATYYYASYLKLNTSSKWVFASAFAFSPLYFRFTVYWPFFSDVFVLLPLLFASIERFFKTGKVGLFIIIVAFSLMNNFYFAYYQCLMGLLYFLFRLVFTHKTDVLSRRRATWIIIVSTILGFGSSLVFFFHGARSFFNNERVRFETKIPFFEPFNENTNIIFDNYLIVILIITIQALLTFKLYKHTYYKLFAILSLLTIVSAFIPYVDSIFNGFSAPQKRWHYLLAFATSGLIALYVHYFHTIKVRTYIWTSLFGFILVLISAYMYHKFVIWIVWVPIVFLIGLLSKTHVSSFFYKKGIYCYAISVIILALLVSSVFTKYQIFHQDHEKRANTFYVNASLYNTPVQQDLVQQMNAKKLPEERTDWRVNEQDNTPMYQHFKGLSLYSSIFDQQLIDLYYKNLMINIKEESVSRYQSTGGRANIASLFSVRYAMLKDYQTNLPEFFKPVKASGQYRMYENQQVLPAVRIMDHYYDARYLKTAIDREHAMIDGVVLNRKGEKYKPHASNLLSQVDVQDDAIQHLGRNQIKVQKVGGGYTLSLPQNLQKKFKDFYLVVHIKRGQPDSNHMIDVNGYQNNRLFNASKYRTGQYEQLYRVQPDKEGNIHIGLSPTGNYEFKILGLYGENYQTLENAPKEKIYASYQEGQSKIKVTLKKHKKGMMVLNAPYRKGMKAQVDGHPVTPQRVNYFMIGIPVDAQAKHIEITYRPPWFFTMIILSFIFALLSYLFSKYIYLKINKRKSEAY